LKSARVVMREHGDRYGSEFAVLKVEGKLHPPAGWSRDLASGDRLIAVGSDFQAGGGLALLGGRLRLKESLEQRYGMTLLYTTVPVWHGDSGGPLYAAGGSLVGINVGYHFRREGLGFKYHRIACAPHESKLAEILARDRGHDPLDIRVSDEQT
jgi:S1-C subfamily serine protease